jgi:hypothetical protein
MSTRRDIEIERKVAMDEPYALERKEASRRVECEARLFRQRASLFGFTLNDVGTGEGFAASGAINGRREPGTSAWSLSRRVPERVLVAELSGRGLDGGWR